MPTTNRPRVAIVGGGIAGLTAAIGLQDEVDTVLFEARSEVGGHILPVPVTGPSGAPVAVDTGFVVFVPGTYPQLTAMLGWLGIDHGAAVTPFRITDDVRDLSFPAANILKLCGDAIPKRCRRDLYRLYQCLLRIRKEGLDWIDNVPLQSWMDSQGFDLATVELGVLPWVASFWGIQPETVCGVSARVALREIARNAGPAGMHRVHPSTRGYLDALTQRVKNVRHAKVSAVNVGGKPSVDVDGNSEAFDHVVVAVDAIAARGLLRGAPSNLDPVLAAFEYEPTAAVVHRDCSLLPADRSQWCTFHHRRRTDRDRTRSVTTWNFDLLHGWTTDPASSADPVLMTIGDRGILGSGIFAPDSVVAEFRHRHLVSTPAVVDALQELPKLDADQAFSLAGSYLGLGGLHEDAVRSGMRAADQARRQLGLCATCWPW
ncbi:MAG: FAD-dependent oxidoreductase [Nannocystaceae bacterium]|nr:FAD-dependent oxidoreductase [Nannocystaceae bacterium]